MANDLAQLQRRAWLRTLARHRAGSPTRRLLDVLGGYLVPVLRRRRILLRTTLVRL